MATAESSAAPHDIHCAEQDDMLFTVDAHPSADILATGNVDGKITLFSYAPGQECKVVRSFNHHRGNSCRVAKFSRRGKCLISGCKKDSALYVTDVGTGKLLCRTKKAHSAPPYAIHTVSENQLASGDEGGEIKLWDTRTWRSVMTLKENGDYISNMTTGNENRTLLATSGDGSLVAVDLRQRRLEERSDCNESELLSLAVVKGGKKVVCGDGEGVLMIYNWGLWGDITDRYPGHPQSIDSLIAISESVICTGCMDGTIRSVQVLPNQLLGTVGHHTEDFPIDSMSLTHDRAYLVTGSQDCCKFWPVEDIPKLVGSDKGAGSLREVEGEGGWTRRKKRKRRHKWRAGAEDDSGDEDERRTQHVDDFFADL